MTMKKRTLNSALAVMLLVLLTLLCACKKADAPVDVRINEAMSSNRATLSDGEKSPDWIELYNAGSADADLTGWSVTDNAADAQKFVFSGGTLRAGGYLVLFADKSALTTGSAENAHLPFGLSAKKGEDVFLFDAEGKLVSKLSLPPLDEDVSFGLDGSGTAGVMETPTPGAANAARTDEVSPTETQPATAIENFDVVINEYATNDTQTLLDNTGAFTAWVELFNRGSEAVSLEGFGLSDDPAQPDKWQFPAVTLEAKTHLLVYLNGADTAEPLSASFKLSGNEDRLLLCSPQGAVLDECEVFVLFSNLTCGRVRDGEAQFGFFATATPGKPNDKQAFSSVDTAAKTESKELVISEVAPVNTSKTAPDGKAYDYIELYNASGRTLHLNTYKLSDSKQAERFFRLPDRTLAPGACLTVYCTSHAVSGAVTAPFGLNRYGETVYLLDRSGAVVDSLTYARLAAGQSCGRLMQERAEPRYFTTPTPGAANPETGLSAAVANPVFSLSSTYVEAGTTVEIASEDAVFYTTDGSVPTKKSNRYDAPIPISKTTVLRARAYRAGALPSDVATATYLIEEKHTLPVVFLSTDSKNLYDEKTGIWATGSGASSEFPYVGANYWQDWERPIHFEYMTADGVSQVAFDAGVKVFGQFSRALEQKSVSIRLRERYGPKEVCYPFFENSDVNVFSSLVLRNSGQDFDNAHLRDAFCAMVIKNQMDVDFMDYRPVAVYVNGVYHGIYDLREKIDADYLRNHHGVDEDNTDLIKGNRRVQLGSIDNYQALINYIKAHDPADDKVYQYLCTQIDMDNLICYWMCESFFNNTDTGNIRFYRENTDSGRWRWIFFDVDWALFPTTYQRNGISAYLNPQGHGVSNAFSTTIMVRLMRSAQFRKRVFELHKQHLETTFDTVRMLKLFDAMVDEIDEEMKRHTARWNSLSYEHWKKNVQTLRGIVEKMRPLFIEKMKTGFSMTKQEQKAYLPKDTSA